MLKRIRILLVMCIAALSGAVPAQATLLEALAIDDMVTRSEVVFRGTVIDVQQSNMAIGGGEIPTVTYRLRVEEMLKGSADITKGDERYMEIRMVGSLKDKTVKDGIAHLSILKDVPRLNMSSDYVLFMTPRSSAGLSVTMGLGQGAFNIVPTDKEDLAVNQYNNLGLGVGNDGPVSYNALKAAVVAAAGN